MDRIFQWLWDRYGPRYSWALYAATVPLTLVSYLFLSFLIVGVEESSHYFEAVAVAVIGAPVLAYMVLLPGSGAARFVERWAAGQHGDRARALDATYALTRQSVVRAVALNSGWGAVQSVAVAAITGATGWRLVQYALLGTFIGAAVQLIAIHSLAEAMVRPPRVAIAADTGIGDSAPRSRPTLAAWSAVTLLAAMFVFAIDGGMLAVAFVRPRQVPSPVLFLVIACTLTLFIAVPMAVGLAVLPSLRPMRDLAEGTERVAAGDYSQRLPVVQDDDLGALAASFNRMQAGLAERQRLQAAFGSYVDPVLAARLLEQGDDVFTGERREVTVMFVDVRDFTPFAEANTAEDTVARLNALFEIVVPAVVDAGGHVNKFLGDGALAVFGAPNDLSDHADAAVGAAVQIHRLVAQRFGGELRIGIGINTGVVIAGTIGGGSHLEFTLIGDTTNVAARVEQLTKTTGDAILLTQHTVNALASRPSGLTDRGLHALKGKATAVQLLGLDPESCVSK